MVLHLNKEEQANALLCVHIDMCVYMYKYIYIYTLEFLCSFWCIDSKYRDLSLVVCLKLAWLYPTLFSCRLFTKISHSLKLKMQLNVLTLAFKSLAIAHLWCLCILFSLRSFLGMYISVCSTDIYYWTVFISLKR